MPGRGKHRESGNIFFMLFGAVALVGVIGAATMTLVRGPLSTVSAVNQRAKADSQLAIASKLATIAATQQNNDGNCDVGVGDTFIEPAPAAVATPAPAGGGQLPTWFGAAQVDPWGTPYGYCVWDLGQAVGDPACDDGDAMTVPYLTGGNSGSQPVFVVMSAGPNRTFETQCNAWADAVPSNASTLIDKPASSDDVLAALTYEEAQNAADGLWSIKTGDPGTITTDKNVEFASGSTATFQGTAQFAPNSRLDLGGPTGAGLFLLPDQTELLDAECTGANSGALRINTASGFNVLEMCDPAVSGFVALGGAGATVSAIDDLSDAASGTADKFLFLGEGAGLNFNSSSGSNNIGIGINAASTLVGGSGNIVIGNDADTNLATTTDSIVIGNGVTATGSDTMKIGEFLYGSSVYSSSSGMLGIGAVPSVTLDVAGTAEATRFQLDSNTYMDDSSGNLVLGAGGSTRVTIESAGNVGIGVADPNVALDVSGDAQISGDAFADQFISTALGNAGTPNFTFNTATNAGLYYQSSGMGFSIGGLNEMTLTSSGLTVDGFGDFGGYVEGDNFQFTGATNSGLFYASGTGVSVNVGGVAAIFAETSGDVGIGDSTPDVKLDVAGAIRPGDTAVLCGASIYGAIRYASGDVLEMCSSMTNDWETIGTSGGGGGGSGSLWTNNTSYITRGTFSVINTGASLPAGLTGAGARAFWYPDKWSFRAGGVSGTQWDDADIGNYSAAFGLDNTASGAYAFSAGRLNTASNAQSVALGYSVTSGGDSSLATGSLTSATGNYSTAMGLKATASGLRSFAFGLGDPASNPVVSGAGSFGIFMGDQSGVNISTANLMALMGGKLIIDPDATSAANTVPSGSLTVDVEGGVGAMQYCDQNGANCFTALDISGGSVGAPGNDRELLFNSGGDLWTDVNLVFTSAGRLGIGTSNPQVTLDLAATDALIIPHGTTAQRPATGAAGMVRYNSSTSIDSVEYYDAQTSTWQRLATATDATTAAGADTQVQFNSGGSFGADADYTWDMTNNVLSIANSGTGAVRAGNGAVGAPSLSFTADPNTGLYNIAADTIGFATNGAEVARMTTGQIGLVAGAVGAPAYSFTGDLNTGLYNVGADAIGVAANGVNYMTVQAPSTTNSSVIFGGSAAVTLPSGATATRPSTGVNGMIRYNTDNGKFEAFQGGLWQDILTSGGGAITAAGANTQVQFNSGGTLGADADYTWDMTTNVLTIANSGTGAVRAGNGAVGAPSLSFTTDTNTGLYNVGADALGVAANGVNYMTVQAPSTTNSSVVFGGSAAVTLPSGATGARPSTGVNGMIRYNTDNGKFEAYQAGAWQDILTGSAAAAGANTQVQFNSGGSFGADADYTWDMTNNVLSIANSGTGAVRAGSGAVGAPSLSFTTDPNTGLYNIAADTIGFATNGAEVARLTTGQIGLVAGAVGAPAYSFTGDLNTGLYNVGADAIGVAANGVNYLTIQAPGAANAAAVFGGTSAITLPSGSTAERPSAGTAGMLRYNSSTSIDSVEYYDAQTSTWQRLATATDATTAAGANTQVQFNSGGSFGADADYTWDMTNNVLTIANSGTGAVRAGNGAAGAPSLSFTTDTNTGLYNVGADALGVAANGVNYMTVQAPSTTNASVIFGGSAAVTLPSGATAARPSAGVNGMIRYNTDNGKFEAYQAGAWQDILTGSASAATPDRGIQFNSGGAFAASSNLVYTSAGDLGVGIGVPTSRLHVAGTGNITGAATLGDTLNVYKTAIIGSNGVYSPTPAAVLYLIGENPQMPVTGNAYGIILDTTNKSGAGNANVFKGADMTISRSVSSGTQTGMVSGADFKVNATTTGTGSFSDIYGVRALPTINKTSTGTINGVYGVWSVPSITSPGTGAIANVFGLYGGVSTITAATAITNAYSMFAESPTSGGAVITNSYGLYVQTNSTGTNRYAIYAGGPQSYFGGNVGIGSATSPAVSLEIGGTDAILLPVGTTAQRPGSAVNGMIRYNSSTSKFEGYQGGLWTDIITAGASASAPDRGIQFNSGGAFTASSNLVYAADGDLLLTGTHTGTASVPATGAGTRMFFDTQKSAFRAGYVGGTQWDNASIGDYSAAFGINTIASGTRSTAIGNGATASGDGSVAMGTAAVASGSYSIATGVATTASGIASMAMGSSVTAGNGTAGSGLGDGSMALGLVDNAVAIMTNSQVTGIQSLGIFMGDQDGLVMSANNTMGLFGGKMVIDPAVPATQLSARATLDMGASTDAILLPIGDGTNRPAAPFNGMLRYNSASGKFEGYQGGLWQDILTSGGGAITAAGANTQIQFNSGGTLGADADYTWDMTNNILAIANSGTGAMRVGNGAVGAPSLSFTADPNTGLYNVGTDAIGVAANGVNYMTVQDPGAANASVIFGGGAAVTLPSGATAARPSAGVNGMIRYNTDNGKFEAYQGGSWQDILTGSASAATPDRGIQFNSGGAFTASSNLKYMADGDLLLSGTYTGTASVPATGAGTRMFFDTQKAAFRAGSVALTQWDNASIGSFSAAMGSNTIASGNYSVAIGANTVSSGQYSAALGGLNTTASGDYSTAFGRSATASGIYAFAQGWASEATGNNSIAMGNFAYSSADNAVAIGYTAQALASGAVAIGYDLGAEGAYSVAIGKYNWAEATAARSIVLGHVSVTKGNDAVAIGNSVTASGAGSIALGGYVIAGDDVAASGMGDGSMALGLIDDAVTITTPSQVTGIQSYGIFMGDQDGLVMSANNTMGLFGGKMVIDPAVPATQLSARATLDMGASTDAILLPIGDGTNRPAAPFNGMLRYNSASGKFEGYQGGSWQDILTSGGGAITAAGANTQIQFNSGGSLGADADYTWDMTNNVLSIANSGTGAMRVGNGAVGTPSVSFTADTNTGLYSIGADALGVAANGVNYMTVQDPGAANASVIFGGGAAVTLPSGATASRPSAGVNGMLRYNSSNNKFEGYQAGAWQDILTGSAAASAPDRGIQFNSGGNFTADAKLVYTSAGWFGVGTGTPQATLDIAGTDAIVLPRGDTSQRPGTGANGMLRYNTTTGKFEGYQGGSWQDIVTGAAVSTFLSLTDTPASYAGAGGQFVKVNAGANALEFTDTLVNSFSGQPAPTGMVFDDLDDVVITAVASGQFPVYNGTNWVNASNLSWNGTTLAVTGNITFTGTLHDVSDMRLKKDIVPLHDRGSIMDKLEQIGTYSFRMKDDKEGQIEFGVMAQEINKVFPELVVVDESTAEKYMSVNYLGLIAPLLEASKELKAENDDLKTRLASVEDDIKGMKAYTGYGINKASVGPGMMIGMIIGMIAATGFSALFFAVFALRRQRRQMAGQPTSIE